MNKRAMVIGAAVLTGICCFAAHAGEIIGNGDFKLLVKKSPKQAKIVIGDKTVKHWGIAGSVEVITKKGEPNKLEIKSGVIYSYLKRSWPAPATELNGEITASGPGKVKIVFSTTVKKKATQPFAHSKKTVMGEFKLGKEAKTFKFKNKLETGEVGYIYIYAVGGPVLISSISVKTADSKK